MIDKDCLSPVNCIVSDNLFNEEYKDDEEGDE